MLFLCVTVSEMEEEYEEEEDDDGVGGGEEEEEMEAAEEAMKHDQLTTFLEQMELQYRK